MWIVRLALRRPYTFVVMAVLIAILGGVAIATMPVDIFPYIDIPVVSIVWQYNGLSPEEMESRIVTNFERALTSNVIGIEHIESQSHQSVSVVRVYFHPNVQVDLALAQIVTQCQVQVRNMPPGTFPPQVLKYDAASVPILQLGLSSKTLKEQEIFDLAQQLHPDAARDRAGRQRFLSVWRQEPPDHGGPEPRRAVREAAFADRCLERPEPAEPDSAGGHREVRRNRISGPPEQQPVGASTSSTTCRSRRSTARPST